MSVMISGNSLASSLKPVNFLWSFPVDISLWKGDRGLIKFYLKMTVLRLFDMQNSVSTLQSLGYYSDNMLRSLLSRIRFSGAHQSDIRNLFNMTW